MNLELKIPGNSRTGWLVRLAVAIALAVALALGAPSPGVWAHPCADATPTPDMHEDFHEIVCSGPGHDDPHENVIEVDGGRDQELVFRVYPPTGGGYLDSGDKIEISMPEFDFTQVARDTLDSKIKLDDSEDGTEVSISGATINGEILVLTIPASTDLANGAGEYLTITIEQGTGILAPDTPSGFDSESEGYPVDIRFLGSGGENPVDATDENIVVVKNPVSSTVPGATVRMELETYANEEIGSNEEIVLDFSGPSEDASFGLPTTIAKTRIKIRSAQTFDPADVLVQGDRVILTIPDNKMVAKDRDFTISISQLARIKNPFAAGNRVITVSTFVPHYEPDEITAVIRRTTTVSPPEGPRGSEFTLQGKGYATGTVTVFDGDDEKIGPGETLASVKTSRGSFSAKLEALGDFGEPRYKVWIRDSNGNIRSVEFEVKSSMSFQPTTVGIGDKLRVTISDWEVRHQEVAAVLIGGVEAWSAEPFEYVGCVEYEGAAHFADDKGEVSFEVVVPTGIPTGEQTVAVYGHDALDHSYKAEKGGTPLSKKACADEEELETPKGIATGKRVVATVRQGANALVERTVEIVAQSLTISPETAVRGQRVTISGSGFEQTAGNDFSSISVNGVDVAEEPAQFEVSHNGDFSATVTVPVGARTGENEVRVAGADGSLGTGTLTVPEPAIELDSPLGQRGTQVTVTGSGFAANGVVQVTYGDDDDYVDSGQTDSRGNFELSFPVPITAAIGKPHKVTAVMEVQGETGPTTYRAEAEHSPPAGTIETSSDRVSPGDLLTVRGENFPPFAQVRQVEFAGRTVATVPSVSTSRAGSFETQIRIPPAEFGDQPLRVEISGVAVTRIVEVGLPPLSGPPERVFAELVRAGVLLRVWYLDGPTQEWSFYDPDPLISEFSNLAEVKRREVYWMHLSSPHEFQGQQLLEGWNPVGTK